MASPSAEQLPYFGPLLDLTEDAIVATDADWRVTVWNEGARRMYGWTAAEAVGHPATFLRLDESDEQRMDRRRRVAEHGRWRGEIVVQRKDGSKVPIEAIVVAIRDEQGGVSGYLGIHRDITERRRAEEALRWANRRTEAILERISDTFFAVDDQWRYTYVNERAVGRAREAWGRDVSAEGLLGRNCWELFPELLGTAFDRELHRAVREQQVVKFEYYSAPTDSWGEVSAYPSRDGLSVYSRDVTERKEAEQRVEEAREAERGRIARDLHDEALQSLSDAIAVAAMADRTTAEFRLAGELLPVLRRVGEQLRSAIYDLHLGSEEHRPFVELLERLVDARRAMAGDGEIELEIGDGIPGGSLGVEGMEVLRILGEALTNARRHGQARHVRVRVWGTKDGLCAEVSDDGRGFDPASPQSPIHHGITGMRERAELLNGRLEIDSESGAGTTVRMEAPLANDTSGHT